MQLSERAAKKLQRMLDAAQGFVGGDGVQHLVLPIKQKSLIRRFNACTNSKRNLLHYLMYRQVFGKRFLVTSNMLRADSLKKVVLGTCEFGLQ